ncbi:MAG: arginase family protein, partial [Bdellovibrionota bacterium]|nr:arginase family protein [Bdellovibrionota bacterium]
MHRASSIGIVGSCFHLGQTKEGVEQGPSCIRNNGLRQLLGQKFFNVFDYGDLHQDFNKEILWERKGAFRYLKNLSRKIQVSLKENDFSIHLGGDHSVGMSSVHAVKKVYPDAIILWIDAHGDVNTKKQSTTGSLHGMPLAACLGVNDASPGDIWDVFCRHFQCLNPDDLIYLGVRDLDASEMQTLREKRIKHFSSRTWQAEKFNEEFLSHWNRINPEGNRPVYISFDLDAIDPKLASAT